MQNNEHGENHRNHIGGIDVDGAGFLHRQEGDAGALGLREPMQSCRYGIYRGMAAYGGLLSQLLRPPRKRQRKDDGALPERARTP
ncbi:MAG: hypothetical protein II597_01800 [Prevotella sp.]|nr:hypothetical protein [Prevotella sp.]